MDIIEEDNDTSMIQVLDYYKKYSQSRHLHRYFSGASSNYFPQTEDRLKTPIDIEINDTPRSTKLFIKNSDTDKSVAETKTVVSARCNIIQETCEMNNSPQDVNEKKLLKSQSLPDLNYLKLTDLNLSSPGDNIKIFVFGSSSGSDEILFTSKTSTPLGNKTESIVESSTESDGQVKQSSLNSSSDSDEKIQKFETTLLYLKRKIGLPVAYSTPNFEFQNPKDVSKELIKKHCDKKLPTKSNLKLEDPNTLTTTPVDFTKKKDVSLTSFHNSLEFEKCKNVQETLGTFGNFSCKQSHPQEQQTKKIIELSITEPVKINCFSSEEKRIEVSTVGIQTEKNIEPDCNNIGNEFSDSTCDSFEYLSSNALSLNASKNSQKITSDKPDNIVEVSHLNMSKTSILKNSKSEGDAENIERLIDVLQKLLKLNSKRQSVKRLIQKIVQSEDSSTELSIKNNGKKKSVSSKSGRTEATTISSLREKTRSESVREKTQSESVREKTQSESVREKVPSHSDYLLKFAENEREYQISWIDNEISHLSKLKKLLESKESKGSRNDVADNKPVSSTYRVIREGENTRELHRDYVIESDVDAALVKNINYQLEGRKFKVQQREESTREQNNYITADIKVKSEENRTNIKISTLCSKCGQAICICDLASSKSKAKDDVTPSSSNVSSQVSSEQESKQFQPSKSDASSIEHQNLLKKVFEGCECSTRDAKCSCPFVKKLSRHFQTNLVGDSHQQTQTHRTAFNDAQTNQNIPTKSQEIQTSFNEAIFLHTKEIQTDLVVLEDRKMKHSVEKEINTERMSSLNKNATMQTLKSGMIQKMTQTEGDDEELRLTKGARRESKDANAQINGDYEELQLTKGTRKESKDANTQIDDDYEKLRLAKGTRKRSKDEGAQVDDNLVVHSRQLPQGYPEDETEEKRLLHEDKSTNNRPVCSCKCNCSKSTRGENGNGSRKPKISSATAARTSNGVATKDHKGAAIFKDSRSSGETKSSGEGRDQDIVPRRSWAESEEETASRGEPSGARMESSSKLQSMETSVDTSGKSSRIDSNNSSALTSNQPSSPYSATCKCCGKTYFQNYSFYPCNRYFYHYKCPWHTLRCNCTNYISKDQRSYCERCRKKLLELQKGPREGIAYTLTLEESETAPKAERKTKREKMKEVKIKVPKADNLKTYKDNTNNYKRYNGSKGNRTKTGEGVEVGDVGKENSKLYTLREYLIKNRPEFIYTAEYRRQMLLTSRILRERQKDVLKLNFLDNKHAHNDPSLKLFNEREMKRITQKKYKNLPEVQNKYVDQWERRLRRADRAICGKFAKKVQQSVLQGKANFPIDQNVINLS